MSCSQVFTKIVHFSKNSRYHASEVNKSWITKTSLVCYCKWRSCICSLQCQFGAIQFADDLKSLYRGWKYYLYISPNISIRGISRRFSHLSVTFGLMNYFNWFIYYHVTALEGKRTTCKVIRYDHYTTQLVLNPVARGKV